MPGKINSSPNGAGVYSVVLIVHVDVPLLYYILACPVVTGQCLDSGSRNHITTEQSANVQLSDISAGTQENRNTLCDVVTLHKSVTQ